MDRGGSFANGVTTALGQKDIMGGVRDQFGRASPAADRAGLVGEDREERKVTSRLARPNDRPLRILESSASAQR